eukprot:12912666-Prorocentrum_lima.AAC.1
MRQTEIKRGRISMPAAMGSSTPEVIGMPPGSLSPSVDITFGSMVEMTASSDGPYRDVSVDGAARSSMASMQLPDRAP